MAVFRGSVATLCERVVHERVLLRASAKGCKADVLCKIAVRRDSNTLSERIARRAGVTLCGTTRLAERL
jgi:hypothetical protein